MSHAEEAYAGKQHREAAAQTEEPREGTHRPERERQFLLHGFDRVRGQAGGDVVQALPHGTEERSVAGPRPRRQW